MRRKIFFIAFALVIFGAGVFKVWRLKSGTIASPTGRLNVAVYNAETGLYVLALDRDTIKGVYIPADVHIDTARGGGKYPVQKIEQFGELSGGAKLFIKESAMRFLRVPVDGVVFVDDLEEGSLRKIVAFADLYSRTLPQSDLGRWDTWVVWWRLRRVAIAEEDIIDLSQTRTVRQVRQPDGVVIKEAETELFPVQLRQLFIENEIAQEQASIVVVNTVGTANLAQIAADVIESIGGDVVLLENADTKLEGCRVRVDKRFAAGLTLARIVQVFSCQVEEEKLQYFVGDIEVYLGKKFSSIIFGE